VAVAVLVVPTTGSTSLEAYTMRVATAWRQELPGATSAVLYVLAVNDRRHRLEVNNAARVRLPDARAQELLDAARPSLRSADHGGAVRLVMDGVLTALAPAPSGTVETITEAPSAPPPAPTVAPAPAPTVAAPATSPPSEGNVCFGLFCLGAFLLGIGLLVSLVVAGMAKAGKAISQSFSGTTYGHDGASHDPGGAWLHGGAHDTSSWSSSDASSSSAWSSSDASSSSSSDTSSGSGGDFSGGGASSDW
jgi:uncharacterized protein